jgi:hypothetical protein
VPPPDGRPAAAPAAFDRQQPAQSEAISATPVVEGTMRPPMRADSTRPTQVAFEFDDLNGLDDSALALVFSNSDPEVILVALTGANSSLFDRIRRQLPWQAARDLKSQTERLGPIRLSDVEHAQQRLAQVAIDLIRKGLIKPPKNRRFIIAA